MTAIAASSAGVSGPTFGLYAAGFSEIGEQRRASGTSACIARHVYVTSPRTHGTWSAAVLVSVDAVADLDERRLTASPAAARSVAGRADAREAGEVSADGS